MAGEPTTTTAAEAPLQACGVIQQPGHNDQQLLQSASYINAQCMNNSPAGKDAQDAV
jgi:hypothetical protein